MYHRCDYVETRYNSIMKIIFGKMKVIVFNVSILIVLIVLVIIYLKAVNLKNASLTYNSQQKYYLSHNLYYQNTNSKETIIFQMLKEYIDDNKLKKGMDLIKRNLFKYGEGFQADVTCHLLNRGGKWRDQGIILLDLLMRESSPQSSKYILERILSTQWFNALEIFPGIKKQVDEILKNNNDKYLSYDALFYFVGEQ